MTKQVVEAGRTGSHRGDLVFGDERVVRPDLYPEPLCPDGESPADTPEADDAEPQARDPLQRSRRLVPPVAGAYGAVELDHPAGERDEERECGSAISSTQ